MKTKADLDTPALWVDLDVFESNVRALAAFFREQRVAWRPHLKGIKSPAVAERLIAAGAIGVTVAKLGEAEVMAAHGLRDILVANQVVGPQKIQRLVALRRTADVMVAVDSLENVRAIAAAAETPIRVLIEVNVGLNRCGRLPGADTVAFAREVETLPGVCLAGVMGWEGHAVGLADPAEKERAVRAAVCSLVATAQACGAGRIVSCGGSGTYWITATVPGVTEIQAGGAVFGDLQYRRWGVPLPVGLFLTATVISCPAPGRAVVDLGFKGANAGPFALPQPRNRPDVKLVAVNSEHGLLECHEPVAVGDRLDFVVGYSDQTIYCHETIHGLRAERVETEWPVAARGRLM